jgi:hypothetical protein
VFSKAARIRSVSVLWDPAVGKGQLRVPSRERLARCLPTALDAVEAYVINAGVELTQIAEPN